MPLVDTSVPPPLTLSIIVAVSENGYIGLRGGLPWKLSADLQRFKRVTMGHALLMGRVTYESIGRPLPGRTNIVLTRRKEYQSSGCLVVSTLDAAFQAATAAGHDQLFIIGGRRLYEQTLPLASTLYMTEVHATVEGDTRFVRISWGDWKLFERQRYSADEKNQYDYSFCIYRRKNQG